MSTTTTKTARLVRAALEKLQAATTELDSMPEETSAQQSMVASVREHLGAAKAECYNALERLLASKR